MKKIFFIISLFAVTIMSYGQGKLTSNTGTIGGPNYGYLWGATADTLNASDTLDLVVRVRGNYAQRISLQLQITKVSGTVTNNFFVQGAMTNVDAAYVNVDTIANSNASSGYATSITLTNWNYPYIRIRGISGATAQRASYKIWWINRYE